MIDLRLGECLESGLVRPRSVKAAADHEQHEKRDQMAGLLLVLALVLNLLLLALLLGAGVRFASIG